VGQRAGRERGGHIRGLLGRRGNFSKGVDLFAHGSWRGGGIEKKKRRGPETDAEENQKK